MVTARSDVAVIGAGIVGLATAYSLLERGVAVTVYEQGVPGYGQSGGESRIFRHAHADLLWWRSPAGAAPSATATAG